MPQPFGAGPGGVRGPAPAPAGLPLGAELGAWLEAVPPNAAQSAGTFRRPVRELARRPPVTCLPETPIAEAARRMQAHGVGSVVVTDARGEPVGIVTDRDLRGKVVAAGLSPLEPVRRIMSAPLHTLPPDAPAIEALVLMLRRGIHHVPLVEPRGPGVAAEGKEGTGEPQAPPPSRLVGVVSSHDFLMLRDAHPVSLLRAMEQQPAVDDLARLAGETTSMVRRWLEQGASAIDLARITAELNDALVRRILSLTEAKLSAEGYGEPPAPYCWLALGSEGRREQTLRTDQDNALVYDAEGVAPDWAMQRYFRRLAEEAVENLVRCGVPRCPAGVMASNEKWRQPIEVWRAYFSKWVRESTAQDLLFASIFFDFRVVWGDARLAERLRQHLNEEIAAWRAFVRLLAWTAVYWGPPIGLFGRIAVPRWGPGRGSLDLKLQGMLPLVSSVRVHALDLGVPHTNTLDRIGEVQARSGRFRPGEVEELTAAYETITRLRLRQQLADAAAGASSGRLPLAALNRAERAALREAFFAIRRLQDDLRSRFMTDVLVG